MPDPMEFDNQDDWMGACVPKMMDEGKDNDQAVAACMDMWENRGGKSIDATLIAYGGQVKALGGGKIGGYLVRFTGPDDPDLDGEFFTKDTDFGDATTAPVYYQHGLDQKLKRRRLGKATHKQDDFGIWAEAQLDLRDALAPGRAHEVHALERSQAGLRDPQDACGLDARVQRARPPGAHSPRRDAPASTVRRAKVR